MNKKIRSLAFLLLLTTGLLLKTSAASFNKSESCILQIAEDGEVIFEIKGTFKISNPLSQSFIELINKDEQLIRFKTDENTPEENRIYLAYKFSSRQAYQAWYDSKPTKEFLKSLKRELNSNILYDLSF